MSRRCELTGIGPMVGHNVSHSNINAALRTLDFKGGLDVFLLGAKDEQLSPRALKIKSQVKAKAKAAAAVAVAA
jgi:large subunit ribosomal protein L28